MISIYELHPDQTYFKQEDAQELLSCIPINDFDTCTWLPECSEPAERLAIFEDGHYSTLKYLCERHKQMGMW